MKIAYFYDSVYPFCKGGAERRIYEIAKRLARSGHDVDILGMKYWPGEDFQQSGLRYLPVCSPLERYHASGRRSISQALRFGLHSLQLFSFDAYDIIDCGQWPYFHLPASRIRSWWKRGSLVISWYEVWGDQWLQYLGRAGYAGMAVERTFCYFADKLVAVSHMTGANLLKMGVSPEAIEVIPNGIEFHRIRSVNRAAESFDIVSVGRLKNHKNLDVLVAAIAALKREGRTISALIIGEGPERDRLVQLAVQLNVSEQIKFAGGIEDFDELVGRMKAAKLFVNLSDKEGGGSITLFEANASGIPVLAYSCPNGIDPALIKEGINGYLVHELSPAAVGRKMVEILGSPTRLERNREESIAMASQYDWDQIACRHEEVYRELSSKRRQIASN